MNGELGEFNFKALECGVVREQGEASIPYERGLGRHLNGALAVSATCSKRVRRASCALDHESTPESRAGKNASYPTFHCL